MELFNLRRDFTLNTLDEKDILPNPIEMLNKWLNEAIQAEALEPSAMTLSTVSKDGTPSSRVVLLKDLKQQGLVFFSNYNSKKGIQISENNHCAINFIWHELERQVRVEGTIAKIADDESDKYFNSRPIESQIGAWASPQSQEIPNRTFLDNEIEKVKIRFSDNNISRPPHWGGYIISPTLFEFWQGRKNRLHDRIQYKKDGNGWTISKLAP